MAIYCVSNHQELRDLNEPLHEPYLSGIYLPGQVGDQALHSSKLTLQKCVATVAPILTHSRKSKRSIPQHGRSQLFESTTERPPDHACRFCWALARACNSRATRRKSRRLFCASDRWDSFVNLPETIQARTGHLCPMSS